MNRYLFADRLQSIDEVAKSFNMNPDTILEFLKRNQIKPSQEAVDKNLMLRLVHLRDGHMLLQKLEKSKGCKGYRLVTGGPWTVIILQEARS